MRENHLRYYGHMFRRLSNAVVREDEMINVSGSRRDRGRPKKTLIAKFLISYHTDVLSLGTVRTGISSGEHKAT